MTPAFILIIALLATSPILLLFTGAAEIPIVILIAGAAMLFALPKAPVTELERLGRTLSRVKWLLVLPPAWMVIQLLPLPLSGPLHPIWQSVGGALGGSIGHITANVPDTLRALAEYVGWLALTLASAIVLIDRHRAELCLFALLAILALVAAEGLVLTLAPSLLKSAPGPVQAVAATASALGCLLAIAAIQRTTERRQTRREARSTTPLALVILGWSAVLIYFVVTLIFLESSAWIGMLLGVLTMAGVIIMRRLNLLRGAPVLIVLLVAMIGAAALVAKADRSSAPWGLASLANADASTDRLLQAATWLGTGAGTYGSVAPMYQDLGEAARGTPQSIAIKMAVEWGRVSPLVITAFMLLFAGFLAGAALQRGRDSFYAAAAAGTVVSIMALSYTAIGPLNSAIGVASAMIVGLGLSQSLGRSAVS